MDQKKRRNSILKKPPGTDDETTGEITTKIKRRISFSGKKSVKEFLAGEEQATIWGTSYEESAEGFHVNTTESGVVAVTDKRIVLRNRRVVVDANRSNKRRSKKKVNVAENDKENVFIQTPPVELDSQSEPIPLETAKKVDSPEKSELALVKSHASSVKIMMEHLEPTNACSTTFDFINYSGAINKTVTIEQSVDVSLDENELQMFKFRVPVSALDVSPTYSLSRDGSPNIFSGSILMSDEDMKMLKFMKVQMGGLISNLAEPGDRVVTKEPTGMELVEVHKANTIQKELPKEASQRKTINSTVKMDIGDGNDILSLESNSLKRKTITTSTSMDQTSLWPDISGKSHASVVDVVMMDVHSPLRKKPMHKQMEKTMDISVLAGGQTELPRRQTIHFESAAVDESIQDEARLSEGRVSRQTILFDQNQIHEDTICKEGDDPSPVNVDDQHPMELSMVDGGVREVMLQDASRKSSKKRQSIHGPVDIQEDSPKKLDETQRFVLGDEGRTNRRGKSVYVSVDIVEDPPKGIKSSQSRRESVYTPADIVEDSPKPVKESKTNNRQTIYNTDIVPEASEQSVPKADPPCGPLSDVKARSAIRRTIATAVDMVFDTQPNEKSFKGRQSVYTASEMIEDEPGVHGKDYEFETTAQHQKSICVPSDIVEDSPKLMRTKESSMKLVGQGGSVRNQKSYVATEVQENSSATSSSRVVQTRKSIYTPSDMVEDSPKLLKTKESSSKLGGKGKFLSYAPTEVENSSKLAETISSSSRKSIYTPSDIIEDSPKLQRGHENCTSTAQLGIKGNVHQRKSIYELTDMMEDFPKTIESRRHAEASNIGVHHQDRKSIHTPTEIVQDLSIFPYESDQNSKCVRKSIYTATNMVEDSPKVTATSETCRNANAQRSTSQISRNVDAQRSTSLLYERKTIYNPCDMIEDSPKVTKAAETPCQPDSQVLKCAPNRKSVYMALDLVEDSFRSSEAGKVPSLKRQSIYSTVDMVEESPKPLHKSQMSAFDISPEEMLNQKNRQTILAPTSIREDEEFKSLQAQPSYSESQKIADNSAPPNSLEISRAKSRQTTYAPADILEDSPPRLSTGRTASVKFAANSSSIHSSLRSRTQQVNCIPSPESKPLSRKTICTPSDILQDSPTTQARHSIYTPLDIVEDLPKMPESQPIESAPKVIVRHMTLQPGLMGDNAAMRLLQKQKTKATVTDTDTVQLDSSAMEMSFKESAPLPTTRTNFSKLNEQMMRGEVKAFANERKDKMSLFDRLEMIEAQVPQFDSFQKKPSAATGYLMQPKQSSFNDYTLELTRTGLEGRRRKGNEYTMDMSSRMQSKLEAVSSEKDAETPNDVMNLSVPDTPTSGGAPEPRRSTASLGRTKRQTIHFNNEDEMDVSTRVETQEAGKSQPNRQTIYIPVHLDMDKTSAQAHTNLEVPPVFERNPRTIHFHENNEMEETRHIPNVRVEQKMQDVSTMDVSMQDDVDHVSALACGENPTRQSCIIWSSVLETAPNSSLAAPNRQTIYTSVDILEVKSDQINAHAQHNDTMDLSTSVCPQSFEPKSTQPTQHESIGRQRRTIHCNDDLELDDTEADCPSLAQVSHMSQHATSRLGWEKSTQPVHEPQRVSALPTQTAVRKTMHLNQDLELDADSRENPAENLKKSSARQTIYFQENVDMDESVMGRPCEVKTDHEDQGKEDLSKVLPKPRRMTTFDDVPIDVDEPTEKITLRKSSFSRTLKFGEITKVTSRFQTVESDSPLFRPNSKLKRCESTTEIDRSLAEYLKAEAAAACSPDIMAMEVVEQSPQSEYYDAEEEHEERSQFLAEQGEDHKSTQMLEESGMQPLQKSISRRAIEECALDQVAAKEEEPELEQQDMSFELRGLQANRLNHEFFDKELSMSPEPMQTKLPEKKMEPASIRRQTILYPEPMMEQSDIECMSPEKPLESDAVQAQPSRKTIHFTNENAVDESFFDEKLSKPAVATSTQSNRHTVYFNESQNSFADMDTSLTQNKPETQTQSHPIGKSKAAQSMKEILRECNMLFTQSMLKPHLFEPKQSTVYFDAKDISLDEAPGNENSKQVENMECTPTKANKSRIPQLIGSAKKLQSMKKSMEFIQQKLPNLSSSAPVPANDEDPDVRQIDKPAEATQDETSLRCPPQQFQDSFETVEIPRKVIAPEPKQLQESFETVEIPRRATTFQRNDTLYLCQNEVDITNISQKSYFRFEDVPITVSDVSTYFPQKPPPVAKQTGDGTYSPNTTEALCNLDMNKFADESLQPKSCDSEDTAYNIGKFKKRYVELTCESINSTGLNEDIEKTHLSLVNTLDEDETEVVLETCSALQPQPHVPPPLETTHLSASVCCKCKRHKPTVSQNDTTLSSFVLLPLLEYKMDLDALRELRNKPRVADVAKIWRQNLRESDSFNLSDGRSAVDLEDDDTMDNFIASLSNERRMAAQQRQRKEFKQETSFVLTVRRKLQSTKSNWILNDLLLTQNILKFTHTRMRTFAIFISFSKKDPRGVEVEFDEMRIVPNDLHTRVWTAFDCALHYQMLVELPFNLSTLCPKSENLFQLLEHVESVTQDVLKIGRCMQYHVLSSPASLIRDPSGGIYIRKYARTRTAESDVKRTEFQIEVRNIKRLSYESITQPPLYEFDEKIQLLPTGPDFLRVFLADPLRYIKS